MRKFREGKWNSKILFSPFKSSGIHRLVDKRMVISIYYSLIINYAINVQKLAAIAVSIVLVHLVL